MACIRNSELTKITNALAGITQYGYNGVDHLVSVSDPRTLITSYAVDGLDNQKQLVSPDTGATNSPYNAAGNLKTPQRCESQDQHLQLRRTQSHHQRYFQRHHADATGNPTNHA